MDFNITNPFPGLRAFEEDEDILFFGREKQVDELRRKLRTVRFLAVIGSSGSGKSSLVKSGLIPSLHSGFMAGASSHWRVCTMRPGSDPIGNLAGALSEDGILYSVEGEENAYTYRSIIESTLRRSSIGLTEAYRQSDIDTNTNLLLVVDQFEELFRFSKYESDNKGGKRDGVAFINLLLKAADQKTFPIYIVLTMRSDFLGDCTAFRGLPEIINEGQYLVPRMTREERREAISGPIAVGGAEIAPELLNLLLNDVGDNPDQLPILQHALMRTWNIWEAKYPAKDKMLDVTDYEAAGTMDAALSQHAEEAYNELSTPRQKQICEAVFKALTDKGKDARGVRRPQTIALLMAITGGSEAEIVEMINTFRMPGRAFLMPPYNVPLTASSIIDISHESLMRGWDRLINWVEEESQSSQIYRRLCEAADLYETGKGGLLHDPELQISLKWREQNNPNAAWAARWSYNFDRAMLYLDYSGRQAELEQQHKEKLQHQRLRRTQKVTVVIALFGIVALFLAIYSFELRNQANKQKLLALRQKQEAVTQKRYAEANREEALKQKNFAERSRSEAIELAIITGKEQKRAIASEQNAIRQQVIAQRQTAYAQRQKQIADANEQEARSQAAIADSQKQRAVVSERKAVDEQRSSERLKELAEARNIAYQSTLAMNEGNTNKSRELALQAYMLNKRNRGPQQNNDIYAALQDNLSYQLDNKNQAVYHHAPVRCIAVRPGTNMVFSADEAGRLYVSEGNKNILKPVMNMNLKRNIRAMAFSPRGNYLCLVSADGSGTILYLSDDERIDDKSTVYFNFGGIPTAIASVNEEKLLIATTAGAIVVLVRAGKPVLQPLSRTFYTIITGSSGKIYAASGESIWIYNSYDALVSDHIAMSYQLNSQVLSLAVNGTEQYLAAGTYDGSIWLRDIRQGKASPTVLSIHKAGVRDLEFSRNGSGSLQLACASTDQTVQLIDVEAALSGGNAEDVLVLRGHNKWVYALCYSSDGQNLYSCGEDNKIITWERSMDGLYNVVSKKHTAE